MENQDVSKGFQQVDNSQTEFFIKFLEDVANYPTVREWLETQLKWMDIQPGHHVLDVGCGIGDYASTMAKLAGPTGVVVGTDISLAMVEVSRSRHADCALPLEFIVAAAAEQPFPDQSFDRIHMERVMMYISDVDAVFRELHRLLKPGGRLLICDMMWDSVAFSHPDKALTRRIVHFIADSFPSGRIGTLLWQYFSDHGFRDLEARTFGYSGPTVDFPRRVVEGITRSGIPSAFTQEEVDGFWSQLEEDSRKGRYFSTFPGTMVTGVKE